MENEKKHSVDFLIHELRDADTMSYGDLVILCGEAADRLEFYKRKEDQDEQ